MSPRVDHDDDDADDAADDDDDDDDDDAVDDDDFTDMLGFESGVVDSQRVLA